MLENKTILQGNAVEKNFCIRFEKATRFPMSEEDTETLVRLLISKQAINIPEKEKPFLIKLIEQRIKGCFTFVMNDSRLSLFLSLIAGTAGGAVMYLTYIQYWCKKNNCKEVNLEKFCEIFPIGFPKKSELQMIWSCQKVKTSETHIYDNLLDYQSAMTSIQFPITINN